MSIFPTSAVHANNALEQLVNSEFVHYAATMQNLKASESKRKKAEQQLYSLEGNLMHNLNRWSLDLEKMFAIAGSQSKAEIMKAIDIEIARIETEYTSNQVLQRLKNSCEGTTEFTLMPDGDIRKEFLQRQDKMPDDPEVVTSYIHFVRFYAKKTIMMLRSLRAENHTHTMMQMSSYFDSKLEDIIVQVHRFHKICLYFSNTELLFEGKRFHLLSALPEGGYIFIGAPGGKFGSSIVPPLSKLLQSLIATGIVEKDVPKIQLVHAAYNYFAIKRRPNNYNDVVKEIDKFNKYSKIFDVIKNIT